MEFSDKWAAIVWMCRNQLGRRNITDEQKTALIGEAYKAQKLTQGTNNQYVQAKSEKDHNGPFQKKYENTAQRIADDFKGGEQTVKRAEHFVDGLDEAEKIAPGSKNPFFPAGARPPNPPLSKYRDITQNTPIFTPYSFYRIL